MNTYTPTIVTFPTSAEVDAFAAEKLIATVQKNPQAILMVAAGNSTKGMIANVIAAYERNEVSFARVRFVGLDEYWKIKPDDTISTARRMWENFFGKIGLTQEQFIAPDGNAPVLEQEIKRFADRVASLGTIDVSVVGMGPGHTCHVGMNNPGSYADSRIRSIVLDRESRDAMMKKLHLTDEQVPVNGITIGMAEILESKEIMVIAIGESKAWGVKRSLTGEIHPESPASLLRYHTNTTFVLDSQAASLLSTNSHS